MDLGDNDVVLEEEKSAMSSKPASRFTTTEILPEGGNPRDVVGMSKSFKPSPMNSTGFSGVGNAADAPGTTLNKGRLHQKAFSGTTTNVNESEDDGAGGDDDDDDDEDGDEEDINLKNEDLIVRSLLFRLLLLNLVPLTPEFHSFTLRAC